jgi:hypothetical protein
MALPTRKPLFCCQKKKKKKKEVILTHRRGGKSLAANKLGWPQSIKEITELTVGSQSHSRKYQAISERVKTRNKTLDLLQLLFFLQCWELNTGPHTS